MFNILIEYILKNKWQYKPRGLYYGRILSPIYNLLIYLPKNLVDHGLVKEV